MVALVEAQDFLWRHPEVVTDVDDPIEILRALSKEVEDHEEVLEELNDKIDDLQDEITELRSENLRLAVLVKGLQKRLAIIAAC